MSENISEVLLFTYIPFVLLVLILLSNKPKEETRDIKFYWGNRIQERINLKDNKLLPLLYWIITIGVILLLTVIFLFMGNLKIVDISKISYILPISKGKEVFVTDLAVASAYSLVLALKKKIYLGISIQDVLNNTFLPDILQFISINSIIIMIGIGVYRIEYMAGSLKLLIVIVTKITYWLWNLNILCLFCEMVRMFTRVTKSELKAFNALRYRINDCYKIENENIVNELQTENEQIQNITEVEDTSVFSFSFWWCFDIFLCILDTSFFSYIKYMYILSMSCSSICFIFSFLFSLIYFRNLLYNIVKYISKSGVSMNINTTYTKIITGEDLMETAQHGSTLYPFQFYYEDLSVFDFNCIEWHWHTELEFIYIESGTVTLWIGEDQFHLTEGNGIFINTKVLHRLYSPSKALIPLWHII